MRRGGDSRFVVWGVLLAAVGCATATQEDSQIEPNDMAGSGGVGGNAGVGVSGTPNGGVSTGGTPSGGVSTGGTPSGGVSTGGTPSGGVSTGGTPSTGGTDTGGVSTGGAAGSASGSTGKGGSTSPFGGASAMGGSTSGGRGGAATGGASGGKGGSAGASGGKGGGSGAGNSGGDGGTGTMAPCPNPRMPAETANSGNFGTTAAVCYQVTATFNTWRCSNIGDRTVTVNGMAASCSDAMGTWPLPAKIDGSYYFEFSAGMPAYTSFFWYTQ